MNIIPCLRYRDAARAVEWLGQAFGFMPHLVVPNPDGTIAHAELRLDDGMIMVGSVLTEETEYGQLIKQPEEIGGGVTQSIYVVVENADSVYAKATAAKIVIDIKDEDYGGRDFTCYDLEGHLWTFGTYRPSEEAAE